MSCRKKVKWAEKGEGLARAQGESAGKQGTQPEGHLQDREWALPITVALFSFKHMPRTHPGVEVRCRGPMLSSDSEALALEQIWGQAKASRLWWKA